MIDPKDYYRSLKAAGVSYFSGVPDSLLQSINACIRDHSQDGEDLIVANEGAAVAYSAGRYLATGEVGMVYMQNSGFGNIVNPLTSLIDPEVYSIPMLFLIGWRGQPGVKDEPQHIKQGRVQEAMMKAAELEYEIHPDTLEEGEVAIKRAMAFVRDRSAPYAFLVPKGTFGNYQSRSRVGRDYPMMREEALGLILTSLGETSTIVATTGKTSREVYEFRMNRGQGHAQDFLTVGSMGHASHIALGIAQAKSTADVCCIDGDGAALMHLGALPINASLQLPNFRHIVINNGAHESVGGQPTVGFSIDLPGVALASGYRETRSVTTADELSTAMEWFSKTDGPLLLEVKVAIGSRSDLGRPAMSPRENKVGFMKRLHDV